MRARPAALVLAAIALTTAGCAATTSTATAQRTTARPSPDPVAACLQLHQWKLSNADGVSPALQRKLAAETKGTALGTDVAQWEQDLAAAGGQSSSSVTGYITTLLQDAQAVAQDCAALGVRNTLG